MPTIEEAKKIFADAINKYQENKCKNPDGSVRGSLEDPSWLNRHGFYWSSGHKGYQRANSFLDQMKDCETIRDLILLTSKKEFLDGTRLKKILKTYALVVYYGISKTQLKQTAANLVTVSFEYNSGPLFIPTEPYDAICDIYDLLIKKFNDTRAAIELKTF